ncbi:hypothetical protein ABES38_08840 [Bacillus gobiensis]|uniref:hypothetical protein n=1 Tax=Bacillus gobiensis TaxID=1441095 RepID=UPI003D262AA5
MSENNNEELKLKGKFLINIESRTDEKKRKFTRWLQAQSNPQNSFLSLIEHCIDRFGYVDVTDHEIAKKLYTELLYFNNESIQSNEKMVEATFFQTEDEVAPEKLKKKPRKKKEVTEEDQQDEEEEQNNIDADLSSF